MPLYFNQIDKDAISNVLNIEPVTFDGGWAWHLTNKEIKQKLVLTIYFKIDLGDDNIGSLISVQTQHGYFELHDCSNYIVFEPNEVIFLNSTSDKISSLIISSEGTCSLYANINKNILNSDFSELDPAILLSAMQLSLTEDLILSE